MSNIIAPNRGMPSRTQLTPAKALRWAWFCWAALLVTPYLFLQWLIWHLAYSDSARMHAEAQNWFVGSMAYLAMVVPGTFFWRGHLFKEYWLGRPVSPRKYILATITVGGALALGGIFSMVGCVVTGSFMPNLIPALMALLLFVLHWPTGRAMARPVGQVEDPEFYEEPS